VDSDFGTLKLLVMNRIPADELYIINPEYVKIHPYKGGKWREFDLPSDGDYHRKGIYGDYTIVVKNERAMGKITGISTTA
jgi:hypothetical protein